MSFFDCIYQLVIGPLKLIFEFIFVRANNLVGNPGLAIIFLSLAMNILVLPLYRRADKMQEDVRNQEKSLEPWVSHIKKTFSGNERMMMLSTYYRQRGYKPIYALKGSLSLLLEIPFFLAAYGFISGLEILNGVRFGPISDLGMPDGLINLFGISVNFLPILMTIINIIAAAIYLKGFPLKSKIQMYGIAVIFLVLLYNSPAGLVFYWTLNNLFSLGKNIFYKLKNPKKVLMIGLSVIGIIALVFVLLHSFSSVSHKIYFIMGCLVLQIPLVFSLIKKHIIKDYKLLRIADATKSDTVIFILCCSFLTVLEGVLIPSAVISDSTSEFISSANSISPLWFIVSAFLYAAGLFLVWFNIFYYLASSKIKKIFCYAIFAVSIVALVNYLFFGTDYGNLSSVLVYDDELNISKSAIILNGGIILIIAVICGFLYKKVKLTQIVKAICFVLCGVVVCMSVINVVGINKNISINEEYSNSITDANKPIIPLSSEGKNVVVLMLDRAIGNFVPYLLSEKPNLRKQFAGFTYYPNTVTFGASTNLAVPEIFGGYEYTPEESNKRDRITLEQKHDEALKLMPTIFSKKGYQVTVGNPTYAGYVEQMNLSIYDDLKGVYAFKSAGKLLSGLHDWDKIVLEDTKQTQLRNFFCYSLFKTSPLLLQNFMYSYGSYNSSRTMQESISRQSREGLSKATGLDSVYLNNYAVMNNLSSITKISDNSNNTFFMMCNDLTHSPTMLQMPDYVPEFEVDNTKYDRTHLVKHSNGYDDLKLGTETQVIHYHVNMEAFLLLGDWFEYLREKNVYDNTRIILVSDHGFHTGFQKYKYGDDESDDVSGYNPILLVKDFNSKKFMIDNKFMTNADVPTLAFEGLVKNPKNPVTGVAVNSEYKSNLKTIKLFNTDKWQISENGKYKFSISKETLVELHDDLFNPKYWKSSYF